MGTLETAVLRTIAYAAVFSYPLTLDQVWTYLIADRTWNKSEVEAVLTALVDAKILGYDDGFFVPRSEQSWVVMRRRRAVFSEEKWKRGSRVARLLTLIPSVYGVYLTGAVAMHNADEDDDIDLMIVTRAGTLWTTRILVTLLLHVLGMRRAPGHTLVADRLCTNLYLDEHALAVPEPKRSLYSAHEVVQAQFVAGVPGVHRAFAQNNDWCVDYLPHSSLGHATARISISWWRAGWSWLFVRVNGMAYRLQRWYMRRRLTRETVGIHLAYFHPRDTAALTQRAYETWCEQLGVSS